MAKLPWMTVADVMSVTHQFIVTRGKEIVQIFAQDLSKPFLVLDIKMKHAYVAKCAKGFTFSCNSVSKVA